MHYYAPRFAGYHDTSPNVVRFPSIRPRSMPDYPLACPPGRALWRQFRTKSFDLVHTHTPFVMGFTGLRWARRLSIPVVSTNHTLYTEYVHYVRAVPERLATSVLLWWMRYYYNRCAAVIVPSAATGARLEGYGVGTPWRAIPTGIASFAPVAKQDGVRERYGIPEGDRLLVFVGRVAREKNVEMLLTAFEMVHSEEPSARLVVVGGGPHLAGVQSSAKSLGLDEAVTFTGAIAHEDLAGVLSEAALFVFPSVTETQGLAIGEAASLGVPAVAVRAGGVPEFVRDGQTGYLVANDPAEFASRAVELLRDEPKRQRFSAAAREMAATMTVEAMATKVIEVYELAMGRGT